MIWYCPCASVTVLLTFSINAGLATSMVKPGMTAPESSFTMPVIQPQQSCGRRRGGVLRFERQQIEPSAATLGRVSDLHLHLIADGQPEQQVLARQIPHFSDGQCRGEIDAGVMREAERRVVVEVQ